MILKLRTNAYAPELASILDLVSALMAHLATCPGPVLDEAEFVAVVPQANRLLKPLRVHIDKLLANTTRGEREQLAEAVTNDHEFDRNIDSRSFSLLYPALPAHVQEHSKALLTAFYDTLLKKGFPIIRGDGTTVVVNRRLIERGFFESNPGIRACPACTEAEISLAGDGTATTNDCDHYLQKSIYGPLAIHPQNLVFVCIPCNQRRKGRHDPLAGPGPPQVQMGQRTAPGSLRRSYLPYRRSASSELRIKFVPEGVTLTADTDDARERVASLDRVFRLADVWSDVLPRAQREMFEELKGLPTKKSVKAVLDDTVSRDQGAPEQLKQGVYLRSRYAAHLREDRLDVLTKEWQRKSAELRKSAALYR